MLKKENIVVFDIETTTEYYELTDAPDKIIELWRTKHKKHYVEEFGIDLQSIVDSYKAKGTFHPEYSKVVCIGLTAFNTKSNSWDYHCYVSDNEAEVLKGFSDFLYELEAKRGTIHLCGHAVKNFDVPFLCRRIEKYPNVRQLPQAPKHDSKPWDINILDTQDFWLFGSRNGMASLDEICYTLDIESPKTDFNGGMVAQAYHIDKAYQQIADYCLADVKATLAVFLHLSTIK